jgi:hypothetical protein
MAAAAPSNFLALNAEAQKKAIETKGESIAKGMQNLLHDMRQGHVSMTDESVFEVGKNVATTEGAVVFENELFQLIEYKPLTAKVYERPFLLVPPCINKFYILDLQPDNSLIRYAVEQGHRTFVVSWRNPDESMAQPPGTTTSRRAIKAIRVVQDITGAKQINALGFCVGGTILSTRWPCWPRAARKPWPAPPADHAAGLHRHRHAGRVHRRGLRQVPRDAAGQGRPDAQGQDLASTFSFLRPNDLVWNYVVGNYLKGETPPPFDLLYWNSDSTNLPGPMYAWYLRNTYLENNLVKPGKATVCGEKNRPAQGGHAGLHLRLARRPHRAHWRRLCVHPAPAGQEALCDGRLGPHRRRDQPAGQEQAQPLDRRQVPQDAANGGQGRQGAARQLVDRLVRLAQGPRGQADCCAQDLWQGQVQGHRARARPLRQGQSLNHPSSKPLPESLKRRTTWKTSSSFQPPAPPSASSAARSPRPRPPSWARIVIKEAAQARQDLDADQIGEVIMGQVLAAGAGQNPARQALIKSGLPKEVPAPDHQRRVRLGPEGRDAGRAGRGLGRQRDRDRRRPGKHERFSPHVLLGSRDGQRMGDWKMIDSMIVDGLWDVYNQYHMGITAENVAKAHGITRDMQDALALASQHQGRRRAGRRQVSRTRSSPFSMAQKEGRPDRLCRRRIHQPQDQRRSPGRPAPRL